MPARSMYATSHQSHITGLTCMNMYDTYVSGCFGVKGSVHPAHRLIEVVDTLLLLSMYMVNSHPSQSIFVCISPRQGISKLRTSSHIITDYSTGKRIAEAIDNPRPSLLFTFVLYLIKLGCMRSQNICFCLSSAAGCLYLQVAAILLYASFPCLNFVCLAGRF